MGLPSSHRRAGFAGSAVVRHLLAHTEVSVVNIDKLTYAANLASIAGERALALCFAFAEVNILGGGRCARAGRIMNSQRRVMSIVQSFH
jgi:dTDP-glucose 4,6-dehydratase